MWSVLISIALAGLLSVTANGGGSNFDRMGDICDHICQCHNIEDNLSVHCVRMNLRNIPAGIPTNVTILDLSMNNITLLSPASFKAQFPTLHRLDLRMNRLSDIKPGTFAGLSNLQELGLDHNELHSLHKTMFSDLYSLSMLSVNNNKIASVENGTFKDLTLKHLNFHDNNPLQTLQPGIFQGSKVESLSLDRCCLTSIHVDSFMPLVDSLKNLFWSHSLRPLHLPARLLQGLELSNLWLSDNQMTDFDFLSHTKALHLDLSNNPIGEMDLGAYVAMEHVEFLNLSQTQLRRITLGGNRIMFNLEELDISENFLTLIDGNLFQRMPSLTRLDMSGNQLHYVGASLHLMLYQLEFWDLTGNRLLCDCRLEWFRHWATVQNRTHLQGAVCGLPRLAPVVGSPEFTCEPPSIQRISSDLDEGVWHLQCDAEGWPAPRITWLYNISRHQSLGVHERSISYHGHPYRNSSILVINDLRRMAPEFCLSFICVATNSEGKDKTEYVHCLGHQEPVALPPPLEIGGRGAVGSTQHGILGPGGIRRYPGEARRLDRNSTRAFARHRSFYGGAPPGAGYRVSVGISSAAVISLVAVGVVGLFLYSRRRADRMASRPGWEQQDTAAGEGLADSTKCLVEHNENTEHKITFSIDTV